MPNPNFIFLCMRRRRMLERGGDERGGEVKKGCRVVKWERKIGGRFGVCFLGRF